MSCRRDFAQELKRIDPATYERIINACGFQPAEWMLISGLILYSPLNPWTLTTKIWPLLQVDRKTYIPKDRRLSELFYLVFEREMGPDDIDDSKTYHEYMQFMLRYIDGKYPSGATAERLKIFQPVIQYYKSIPPGMAMDAYFAGASGMGAMVYNMGSSQVYFPNGTNTQVLLQQMADKKMGMITVGKKEEARKDEKKEEFSLGQTIVLQRGNLRGNVIKRVQKRLDGEKTRVKTEEELIAELMS